MIRIVITCVYSAIIVLLFIFTVIRTPIQYIARNKLYSFVKKDGLLFSVAFLAAIILYTNNDSNDTIIIDAKQFSSIAISVVIAWFVLIIKSFLIGYLEDPLKLTDNYEELMKQYKETKWLKNEENNQKFPVIVDADLANKNWTIIDKPYGCYKLPDEIHGYEPELMAAHKQKDNYNSLAIRVCKWEWDINEKVFKISTGRTTYFNSLLTNRAMDYKLKNGYTVRDLLCYGPNIPDLKKSKLSNQIGVNGFLISSDHYLCLVYRGTHLAIGKRTYGTSISGDIHTRYKMESDNTFKVDKDGILESIRKTYIVELRLREYEGQKDDDILDKNSIKILAAYRDIVEGNKPQLLSCVEYKRDKKEIETQFKKGKENKKRKGLLNNYSDGDKLIWISMKDLQGKEKSRIYPSKIVLKGKPFNKTYGMVPSASASLLMLMQWEDIKKTTMRK